MADTTADHNSSEDERPIEMSVSIDKVTDIERKVAVEIPWDEVKGRLDDAYRELGHGVTVKGFRRGKVPRKMLERMFGKHVNKEVAQRLVQQSITKALTDNEITPVSEPKIEESDIADGNPFCYSAVLQVVPEIEPKDYFGVDVKQRPAQVSDEALQQALESKRREMTDYRPVEDRATEAGDVVLVDVMGKVGDQPVSYDKETVELGETPTEPIPGLAAKLTGIAANTEELDVELDVPAGDDKTEKARLLVTVHDVKQRIVPELDDEFAKDTGEAETLDELKEVLRATLAEADEAKAVDEAKQAMVNDIVKRNDVPAVPALVDRHLERMVSLQLQLMGIDPNMPGLDRDAIKDRARDDAEQTVRSMLLLQGIGKKENVEVQEADIEKRLAEIASARGQNVARVRGEYEKEGRIETIKTSLREEKTLDLLWSKANISIEENAEKTEKTGEEPESNAEAAPVDEGDQDQQTAE